MVEWRPVVGYEDRYLVSDTGRVKSLNYRRTGVARELQAALHGRDLTHLHVHLTNGSRQAYPKVHVLVLEAFVGPRPAGMVARHLNDIPTDNRVENLAWGTYTDNAYDAVRNGCHGMASRTHCGRGHEYTASNTSRVASRPTVRVCLACKRETMAATRPSRAQPGRLPGTLPVTV